ncbi:hypothetical protein RB195_007994 [Necator americanus]|uniref:Nucleotide-diphospho-sugar transferase domain-containing protein n=1 Tax=Necator americanus TaxID=51031 RepID=A0ABR1C2I9_NECAM
MFAFGKFPNSTSVERHSDSEMSPGYVHGNWCKYFLCFVLFIVGMMFIFDYSLKISTPSFTYIQRSEDIEAQPKRKDRKVRIAIVTVLKKMTDRVQYTTAMTTMECYSKRLNYTYVVTDSSTHLHVCNQTQVVFQRHCIVRFLFDKLDVDWILMVDADIAVVNEKRRIEEFIDWSKDIIFYERFFNFEITAGTYLAKNSEFTRNFLQGWAEFESRLPSSFHGKDQGALHAWMIELFAAKGKLYTKCIDFWNRSKSYTHLEKFTLCSREALKIADTSKVLILKEGKGWCRDAWLTNSHWNPETDFMFHAWKEVNKLRPENKKVGVLSGPEFYPWFNTLKTPLTKSQCLSGGDDWTHDADFIVPVSQLQAHLNQKLENVERSYQHLREQLKL